MPRTKAKSTAAQETISINEALAQTGRDETAFRLALSYFRPDDFDTIRAIPLIDFEAVTKKLAAEQPQLPAQSQNLETAETHIQEALETTTREPQKSPIVPSAPQQQLSNPTESPTSNTGLSVVEQLAKQASEEIAAADAIAQVRNTLILNNLAVRDTELVEGINQRWQYQKQGYLGAIRDLASLAKEPVETTPDKINLTQEIDEIISELGKKLIA